MASTSNLVINSEPVTANSKVFKKKEEEKNSLSYKWYFVVPLAVACLVLLIVYLSYKTTTCVVHVNGIRNATFEPKNQENCTTSLQRLFPLNQTLEVRVEKVLHRSKGVLIGFVVCLTIFILVLSCIIIPCNLGNYRSCHRRMTCCCKSISLRDGIHRYMDGYISDEKHFRRVVQSGQEGLDMIVEKLKYNIPEVTFDVLMTGSLQERLGKPTVLRIKSTETRSFPMKSILSSDFDVMLTPQTVMATKAEDPHTTPTLFNVVTLPNMPPGFVWLKLNQDFHESRNTFWRNLCNEFNFSDGSRAVFLSSHEVRNVFMKGMKKIRRNEVGYFDWYKRMADSGVSFDVKAQGPAVTVEVKSRETTWSCTRPTLFYGDLIFAIRCTGWPQQAQEWPLRPRNWPPPPVIQEVMTYGYHVVPKPSVPFQGEKKKKKKKKKKEMQASYLENEWRLSYSLAEIILSRHIPPVARGCFLALKGTLKRMNVPTGSLCSYHLKTVLFWALELNSPDIWCEERIEECFVKLVDTLLECTRNKFCSHYFMPQVNLMASTSLGQLVNLVTKIKQNPADYVSCRNLRCLGNLAACYECIVYNNGDDVYMDVY